MKKVYRCGVLIGIYFATLSASAQTESRREIRIPDILGYQTLKCDFQTHTVFSDGDVWPTVRVQEAWREGLDVLAITDHIEYRPHSSDMEADHNRSFELAKPMADQYGLVLVRGAEITRNSAPGHLTAIFIRNANLIEREDWYEACVAVKEQGGFLFMNQKGVHEITKEELRWAPEHSRLLNAGLLKGIEVYSGHSYYPKALGWAQERNLVIFGNSNMHEPSLQEYKPGASDRPITLVFSLEKSEAAIKSAILDNRTAVLFNDTLIGERRFLTPIFINSVQIKSKKLNLQDQDIKYLQLYNNSDIPYYLTQRQPSVGFECPKTIYLPPNKTVSVELIGISEEISSTPVLKMFYEATNLLSKKGEKLPVNIDVPNK